MPSQADIDHSRGYNRANEFSSAYPSSHADEFGGAIAGSEAASFKRSVQGVDDFGSGELILQPRCQLPILEPSWYERIV